MSRRFVFLLGMLAATACATAKPQKTQLELREFQTRSYDTTDSKMVMKAVLNVLQDDSYIIKNASLDLGLLSATKEVDVSNGGSKFWSILLWGSNARWNNNAVIECSANISEAGEQTRVRVNFQSKTLDNAGAVKEVKNVDDEAFYREFFAKVDKGIFIQDQKL